nr:hypothetical protein CFP56_09472 [Quercus suber]
MTRRISTTDMSRSAHALSYGPDNVLYGVSSLHFLTAYKGTSDSPYSDGTHVAQATFASWSQTKVVLEQCIPDVTGRVSELSGTTVQKHLSRRSKTDPDGCVDLWCVQVAEMCLKRHHVCTSAPSHYRLKMTSRLEAKRTST